MKKTIFICLAFAMLLPSAIAFDCNSLSGGDSYVCNSIQNMNLAQAEKDLLISDIFNKDKITPNFDFIYSWNTHLNIKDSPNGKVYSSSIINDAWIKIIALMPSIIENNTLYSSNNGKLLTAYNYSYNLPSKIESGDCRTSYYLTSKQESLEIYLNENLIGNNKLSAFIINLDPDNLNFTATLNIRINYYVDHYKNKLYCLKYNEKGRCIRYYIRCQFFSTDYRTDTLILLDNLNAKLYKNQINGSFKITNNYNNLTQGVLSVNNFTKLILSFNNSNYQNAKYIYSLNYTLPYYILTIKAEKAENTKVKNIHVAKNNNQFLFTVQEVSNCKIQLFNHFSSIIKSCDMGFNETSFSLKTDKFDYFENETIRVYLSPPDLLLNISYGNQSKIAKNYTEFMPILYENKISANLNNKEVNVFVNIRKRENSIILYNLGVLSFLVYFFYKAGKVYLLQFI